MRGFGLGGGEMDGVTVWVTVSVAVTVAVEI